MTTTKRFRSVMGLFSAVLLWTGCGSPPPPKPEVASVANEVVVTPPAMANFIGAYVAMKSKGGDGFMTVADPATNADVKLKLKPLQTAEMNPMGMGIFYTCVPMEDAAGAIWDVDFISQKTDRGMSFTDATIHKTPTETRYEWIKNEREIWEKRTN